jgi:hypothetical protein
MATTGSFLRFRRHSAVTVDADHRAVVVHPRGYVQKVPTFLGWTPGLRSVVAGHVLSCGCLVGVYETRAGAILEVLDARGPDCPHAGHQPNAILDGGRAAVID